jgi:simple sugar transport system permease protein
VTGPSREKEKKERSHVNRSVFREQRDLLIVILSFGISLFLGALFILLYGADPIDAYAGMLRGALGDRDALIATLARAVPIVLSTMSIAVAFNGGIWNIGAEGQLFLGAFAAAWVGIDLKFLPGYVLILLGLAAAIGVAMFWAWIPARLSLDRGINIVVLTIMLNSIAILFTTWLATGPYAGARANAGTTDRIVESMRLPHFGAFGTLNWGVFAAVAAVAAVAVMMTATVAGYEWRCCRLNPIFARYGGIDVPARKMQAMLLSGSLAGLAGALLVMGDHYRFMTTISAGYTWTGMILAMMVANAPAAGIAAAIVYAVMSSGALEMELATGVPTELVSLIVCCAVLFVTAGIAVADRLANRIRED